MSWFSIRSGTCRISNNGLVRAVSLIQCKIPDACRVCGPSSQPRFRAPQPDATPIIATSRIFHQFTSSSLSLSSKQHNFCTDEIVYHDSLIVVSCIYEESTPCSLRLKLVRLSPDSYATLSASSHKLERGGLEADTIKRNAINGARIPWYLEW